jgi:hypothetical protein
MDECYRLYDIAGINKYLAMFQGSCGHISRGDASGDNPNEWQKSEVVQSWNEDTW